MFCQLYSEFDASVIPLFIVGYVGRNMLADVCLSFVDNINMDYIVWN